MKAETRQKLFNYMSNEHGLHLLENELDEIERILGDKVEYAKAKCANQRIKCSWAYKDKCDKYSWGKVKFYSPVFESILNAKEPDFE